nr:hypothetical protein [uncultured Halomonas sp.]
MKSNNHAINQLMLSFLAARRFEGEMEHVLEGLEKRQVKALSEKSTSDGQTRQKSPKRRSLRGVNEYFDRTRARVDF